MKLMKQSDVFINRVLELIFSMIIVNSAAVNGQTIISSDTIYSFSREFDYNHRSTWQVIQYERNQERKGYLFYFFKGGNIKIEYYPKDDAYEIPGNELPARTPIFLNNLDDELNPYLKLDDREATAVFLVFNINFNLENFNKILFPKDTLIMELKLLGKVCQIYLPVIQGYNCYTYEFPFESSQHQVNQLFIKFRFNKNDPEKVNIFLHSIKKKKPENDGSFKELYPLYSFNIKEFTKNGPYVTITQQIKFCQLVNKEKCECHNGKTTFERLDITKTPCHHCGMSGKIYRKDGIFTCQDCQGTGWVKMEKYISETQTCNSCNGSGIVTKTITKSDTIDIKYKWKVTIINNAEASVKHYNYVNHKYDLLDSIYYYEFYQKEKNAPILIVAKSKEYYIMPFDEDGYPFSKLVINYLPNSDLLSITGY